MPATGPGPLTSSTLVPNSTPGHRSGRVSFSGSNLANPQSPIHTLASQFQAYLHLPDPTPLYVCMGAMAGNMMVGSPIWMMLVGNSGSGKTQLLKALLRIPHVIPVASIKGEAALLSGVKKKDRAADASGGLLHLIGDNGCMAFMDFTGVLSKSREAVTELLGVFRDLFDRTWYRDVGTEGGKRLGYNGRVCLIAGVTHSIDRAVDVNREMGERCLYFRIADTDGYQESLCAVDEGDPDEDTLAMQTLTERMFAGLGLAFEKPTKPRRLELWERHRIVTLAQFGAKCRSHVPRDSYTHQVIDVSRDEVATRFSKELKQLYLGMEVLGNTQEECWAALRRVTMDSMALSRRMVLEAVIEGQGHVKREHVAKKVRVSDTTVRRVLEDLELLGIVRRNGVEGWEVTDWTAQKMEEMSAVREQMRLPLA